MKQKAQIDIIDVTVPDSDLVSVVDEQPMPPEAPVSEKPHGKRKRLIWLAAGLAIFAFAALGSLWYFTVGPSPSARQEEKKAVPIKGVSVPEKLRLENFFVAVYDDRGQARILRCSLVLDIETEARQALLDKEVTIREKIYRIIGQRSVALLLSPDEKKRLKKDITDDLNSFLGQTLVKEVYFDQYILL